MKISYDGLFVLKYFEKCRLTAYLDGGGVPTIGWGHTGSDVHIGMTISQERADALLVADLERFESDVSGLVKVPLTQRQFDALVCFAYNVGSDIDADTIAEGLGDSTLLRMLNVGHYSAAGDQFLKWVNDNGKPIRGLKRRRVAERELFFGKTGAESVSLGVHSA